MCGILFSASIQSTGNVSISSDILALEEANRYRGPDHHDTHDITLDMPNEQSMLRLHFFASVLHLRGERVFKQPLILPSGDILCFNGEIFGGIDVPEGANDVEYLATLLETLSWKDSCRLFSRIEGPFSFVYYNVAARSLLFSRDILGRRSLLIHHPTTPTDSFILTSVGRLSGTSIPLEEISAVSMWHFDIGGILSQPFAKVKDFFYKSTASFIKLLPEDLLDRRLVEHLRISRTISEASPEVTSLSQELLPSHPIAMAMVDLLSVLDASVKTRVQSLPSTKPSTYHLSHPAPCYRQESSPKARIAILFSGGIDSTTIAILADRHIQENEPIDLLNVAFENPRKINGAINERTSTRLRQQQNATDQVSSSTNERTYLVPDRVSGLEELEELRKLCPRRAWNFVEINVDYQESTATRPLVETLMYPRDTNMDLSLALALYFASRGKGHVLCPTENTYNSYTSTARILLNGFGADELLGGYSRHRTTFISGGWDALSDELQLELDRMSTRNLGRDDRVVSHHGKEIRHPFLAAEVVKFISQLPLNFKFNPSLPSGVGEKFLLRLVATKAGLKLAGERKKRAMQFGTHSARMEGGEKDRKGTTAISTDA